MLWRFGRGFLKVLVPPPIGSDIKVCLLACPLRQPTTLLTCISGRPRAYRSSQTRPRVSASTRVTGRPPIARTASSPRFPAGSPLPHCVRGDSGFPTTRASNTAPSPAAPRRPSGEIPRFSSPDSFARPKHYSFVGDVGTARLCRRYPFTSGFSAAC